MGTLPKHLPRTLPGSESSKNFQREEILAEAKFVHLEKIGLVMLIKDFNELMEKFELKKFDNETQRALRQRWKESV